MLQPSAFSLYTIPESIWQLVHLVQHRARIIMRKDRSEILAFPRHFLRAPLTEPHPVSPAPARKYRLPLGQLQLKKNTRDLRISEGGPKGLCRNSCCAARRADGDIPDPPGGCDVRYAQFRY